MGNVTLCAHTHTQTKLGMLVLLTLALLQCHAVSAAKEGFSDSDLHPELGLMLVHKFVGDPLLGVQYVDGDENIRDYVVMQWGWFPGYGWNAIIVENSSHDEAGYLKLMSIQTQTEPQREELEEEMTKAWMELKEKLDSFIEDDDNSDDNIET